MQNIPCSLCGNNQTSLVFVGKDPDWNTSDEFSVVRCKKCGLVYVNPRPDEEEMEKYYPSENWARAKKKTSVDKALISGDYWSVAAAERAKPILDIGIKGKILDIGCGDGFFLYYFSGLGWDCYGVEPGKVAAAYAREILGLKVLTGSFESAAYPNDFFDIVSLHHVFEHMANPGSVLSEIRRVLKDGGYLVVAVPNFGSFDRKLFGKRWLGLKLPQHLFHYTEKSLKAFFEKFNFKVVDITYKSYEAKSTMYYSESLRYLLRDFGLYPPRSGIVDKSPIFENNKEPFLKMIFHSIERGIFKSLGFICDKLHCGSTVTIVVKK